MTSARITGLGLAVIVDGQPALVRGFGLADRGKDVSVTAETSFEVGSITKAYTTMGVLRLLDTPRLIIKPGVHTLDLDLPIGNELAAADGFALPPAWAPITARQLLSMTSGIPDGGSQAAPWQQVVAAAGQKPLAFPPGTGWCYSNPGFMVLGELLQQLTGQPYDQYMAAQVFAPLGLTQTIVHTPANTPASLATGYRWTGTAYVTPPPRSPLSSFSSGAIISTANDLGRWLAAVVNGDLLTASTYQLMWTDVPLPRGASGWGLGWGVGGGPGDRVIDKDGAVPGYTGQVVLYPDAHLAVGVLTNADGITPDVRRLATQIAAAVAGRSLPAVAVPPSNC